jgi:hypothetical protein
MRIFVITVCSLALATGAYSAQPEQNQQQKKKQPQTVRHAPAATTARPTGHPSGAGVNPKHTSVQAYHGQQGTYQGQKVNKGRPPTEAYHGQQGKKGQTSVEAYHGQRSKGQPSTGAYERQRNKKGQTPVEAYNAQKGKKGQPQMAAYQGQKGKAAKGGKVSGATAATGKPFKAQHFNVGKQPNTAKAPAVKFQQGKHIAGSQNWKGQNYAVFRNYHSEWHDQGWWHSHYPRVTFVFGAPYYWNAGYWYPAWGYSPNAYYAWDGPIYGYDNLPPDQVIANAQAALQQQGYYHGEVDGLLGPLTRAAIADYQRDHGLYTTSTIDEPTLQSLGMT